MTLCNDSHDENASLPIEVTESGMVTLSELFRHDTSIPLADISRSLIILKLQLLDNCNFTLGQPTNGFPLKKVTESGIVTLRNASHHEKALLPIEVTESGIMTLCNDSHDENASLPIEVTESGMVTLSELFRHDTSIPLADISRSLIILKLQLLDNCNFTLGQPTNGFSLNKVTESDIVTFCNDSQFQNASLPIEVTESGIMMLSNDLHHEKALLPITSVPDLILYFDIFKFDSHLSNRKPFLLYITPNSSRIPSSISLSETSVDKISLCLFSDVFDLIGLRVINNLKDTMSRLLLASAIEKAPNIRVNSELHISV